MRHFDPQILRQTRDLYHDWQAQPERVRGVLRSDLVGKKLTNALTGQSVGPAVTQLAAWLGLPTFEFAIIQVTTMDEIRFKSGQAQPGPAFITREQSGMVWSGAEDELEMLVNPADIGKLVLFDTWTRNCDRHPPDLTTRKVNRNNVFLSNEGMADGTLQLVAMDHTHCFNCGRDLNAQLAHINLVKGEEMFGLFPDFKPFIRTHWDAVVAAVAKLKTLDKSWVKDLTVRAKLTLRKRLDIVLGDAALKNYLRRDLEFQIPTLTEKLTVPYGFQNGRFNLIQPVEFEQQRRGTIINAACKHAIEGNYIFKNPDQKLGEMQLCVVADFTDSTRDMADKVETIFQEYHVRMFASDSMENLKQEILTKGKPVYSPAS
jgi:hypothetical protein